MTSRLALNILIPMSMAEHGRIPVPIVRFCSVGAASQLPARYIKTRTEVEKNQLTKYKKVHPALALCLNFQVCSNLLEV